MAEDIIESEYSAHFFGFTPKSFYQEFSEILLDEMSLVVQNFIKIISSITYEAPDKKEATKEVLEVHDEWSQQAEVVLKNLWPVISEFFAIPKHVTLPVFSELEQDYSEDDIKKLEDEVKQLEEFCKKQASEIQMYRKELMLLEIVEPSHDEVDEAIGYLKQVSASIDDVKELDKFTQLCQKNLVRLSTVPDVGNDSNEGRDTGNCDLWVQNAKFKTA